jgi:hypothetical protein
MAWELQTSHTLYIGECWQGGTERRTFQELLRVASQKNDRAATPISTGVKKHTYAHDFESLFWLLLWILTNHTGHHESYYAARAYFQENTPTARRCLLDLGGLPIRHPQLSEVVGVLDDVREALVLGYRARHPETDIEKLGTYETVYDAHAYFFSAVNKEGIRPMWAHLKLYPAYNETAWAVESAADVAQQSGAA